MSRKYKLFGLLAIPLLALTCTSCALLETAKNYLSALTQKRNPDEQLVTYTDALQSKNFKGDTNEYTPEDQKNYQSQQEYWKLKNKQLEEEIISEMKTTENKTSQKKKALKK